MNPRSRSRSWALQVLYAWEQSDGGSLAEVAAGVFHRRNVGDRYRAYLDRLLSLVGEHAGDIDRSLSQHLDNWRLDRLTVIDRNVLRIGAAELLYQDDVPPAVAIHQAIQLAQRYGSAESAKFVNGVLDAVARTTRPER